MNENPFSVLAGEAVPDSRVRVDDVIAAGRTRVRRRRGAVAAAGAAVVVLVTLAGVAFAVRPPHGGPARPSPSPSPSPSVSAHPSGCTVARVDVDGDIGAAFTDPSGRYVAFSRAPDPGLLILYRDGVVVRRCTTEARLQTRALNTAGTAVGSVENDAYRTTADGTVAVLRRPSGASRVWAYGINAAGDIVGEAAMPGKKFRAVLWRHTALDAPVLLPTPSGQSSSAHGITDDGRVLGDLDQGAVFWDGPRLAPLPAPPGYDHVQVTSISADGRVIGGAATKNTGGSVEPFRWDCRP
jgi:hypothetical protein